MILKNDGAVTSGKVAALELLRGLAALQVVFVHLLGFWGAFHHVLSRISLEWMLNILSGRVAVGVFFLLSGYVLSRSSFVTGNMALAALSRYVRLALPTAASGVLVGVLMAAGVFDFGRVRASLELGYHFWENTPSLAAALWQSLVTHFVSILVPDDEYRLINPPTWTISFEFFGSLLVLMFSRLRAQAVRGPLALTLAAAFWTLGYPHSELMYFPLGVILADWADGPASRVRKDAGGRARARVALAVAILAGGLFGWFPLVTLAVFGMFMTLNPGLAPRSRAVALASGRVSFAVYLVHFPLYIAFMTVASRWVSRQSLLDLAAASTGSASAALRLAGVLAGVFIGYGALLALASWLFERFVDRPGIRLASLVRSGRAPGNSQRGHAEAASP